MLVFFDVILRVLSLSKEEGINANVYCKSIYSIIDKGKDRMHTIVKLRQGSGKDRQGMAVKAKGLKA